MVFETVGFSPVDRVRVRDLVHRRELGVFVGTLRLAPLPAHGSTLLNLTVVWEEEDVDPGSRVYDL